MRSRIGAIRDMMRSRGWDAVILTGNDPHASEYSAPRWHQVAWVSGYTGEGEIVLGYGLESSASEETELPFNYPLEVHFGANGRVSQSVECTLLARNEEVIPADLPENLKY